jgi:beta-N-acetylhexosaminidase
MIILLFNGCSYKLINISDSAYNTLPSDSITPTKALANIVTPITVASPTPAITAEPTKVPTPTINPQTTTAPFADEPNAAHKPDPVSYEKIATSILNEMTLEEKVGQMFFVRCRGELAITDLETYHLGGYILFSIDFQDKSKEQITKKIKRYQEASKVPLLIGVDEEGGLVNRISKFPEFRSVPFQSPQELYQLGGLDYIKNDTAEKAKLLKSLGINVNLAPICDVSTNPKNFIYNRSFGKNAKATSEYVKTVVTEMVSQGLGSTLKHFPGYGNNIDTHTGIAIDERSYKSFVESDFLPFQAGIEAGAGSILVSHNIVKSMDKDYPASLSLVVHQILREDLGFQGVIMTDDLSMDAIDQYTNDEAAILAIDAGNDLIIASDFDIQIPAVIEAVKENKITEEHINESVLRILLWKLTLGIIS